MLLLAAGTFFFVPPAEYINGGRDPAVYFNSGIQIAQRGSLLIDDPLVRSVPPQHRELFFRAEPPDATFDSSRFLGFFVLDQEAGTVVGQFPHLYPVWIAIAYETYGLTGARYVHGLWGLLGVLAVYLTGAALFGRRAAFAGAALLAVNVAQVWFARYFCVEMLFQALVFAGVLAYIRAHVDGDRFFAPIAGILIGLTPFLHITGVVAIGALGLAALLGRYGGQRFLASFALPLVVATGLAAAYYLTVLATYTPFWYFGRLRPEHVVVIAGALAVVALAFAAGRPMFAARVRRWLPPVATAALWILAAYALFIRVKGGLPATRDPAALYPEGLYSYTFYYLQPLGLAAALAGWAVVSRRRFWPSWGFLAVAAAFAVAFFYDPHITPDHFWAGRRYVSVILPASLLLIGAAAFTPAPLPDWPRLAWTRGPAAARLRLAAGVVLVAALGWQYMQATRPILRHVEHAGVIPTVEQLAGRFTPDDLLLFGNRGVTDAQAFALPLAYVYGRNVLSLREWEPDPKLLRQFLDWARTRYARVFFIGGATALHTSRTGAALVSREQTRIPHYDRTLNAYPNGVVNWEFNYGIYDLLVDPPPPGPFDLDVGGDDDLQVLGMHPRTLDERGVTYRWTTARSIVWVVGTLPDAREITLHMSNGGRPEAAGVAEVRYLSTTAARLDHRPRRQVPAVRRHHPAGARAGHRGRRRGGRAADRNRALGPAARARYPGPARAGRDARPRGGSVAPRCRLAPSAARLARDDHQPHRHPRRVAAEREHPAHRAHVLGTVAFALQEVRHPFAVKEVPQAKLEIQAILLDELEAAPRQQVTGENAIGQLVEMIGAVRTLQPVGQRNQPLPVGCGNDGHPARLEDAPPFAERTPDIGHVLNDLAGEERIELAVPERHGVRVEDGPGLVGKLRGAGLHPTEVQVSGVDMERKRARHLGKE